MAAIDVMRRYLQAVQRGDWETGFGFFADDVVLHVPAARRWPASTVAVTRSRATCTPPWPGPTTPGSRSSWSTCWPARSGSPWWCGNGSARPAAPWRSAAPTCTGCAATRSWRSGSSRPTSTRSTTCSPTLRPGWPGRYRLRNDEDRHGSHASSAGGGEPEEALSLRLPGHWIWDFWFATDGEDVHVFFLHAPRSLGHPDLRHSHAQIGHAVSRDLWEWEVLPTALRPGPPGAFDDLATWTGSVLEAGGRWHMFYSGISTREDGRVQRVGLASSEDLRTWERQPLLVEADPRWYETGRDHPAGEETWRDPWVFQDPEDGRFHMVVCARVNHGPSDGRGVLGHVWSDDLRSWEVGPPLSAPGEFRQLEVPQLVRLGGLWRVVFSAGWSDHSAARLARPGVVAEGGTHYLVSDDRLGPYVLDRDAFLLGDPQVSFYAGRVLHHQGAWWLLAWRHVDGQGRFFGELTDPMPLALDPTGSLWVKTEPDAEATPFC